MKCPMCQSKTSVLSNRDGKIRTRRCTNLMCSHRFKTFEIYELTYADLQKHVMKFRNVRSQLNNVDLMGF